MNLDHKSIDHCLLVLQGVKGLLKTSSVEEIKLPSFAESISITISSLTSLIPNPFPLLSHHSSLSSTKHSLISSQKQHEEILSNILTPSNYNPTPYSHHTHSLISLYNELTQNPDLEILKNLSEDLSKLTKTAENSEPTKVEPTKIFEASGLAEQVEYTSIDPGIHQIDFDMNMLKSALKQPNHKVMYKQVSPTGSIKVSDRPLSIPSTSEPVSSARQVQSFKDFLMMPQKSVITLEGLGENSDSEA